MKHSILFLFLLTNTFCDALKCYSCSLSGSSSDQTCLKNPANLPSNSIINCPKKFCTIFRQELKDPPQLATFSRGCEDTPVFLNKDVVDTVYKTYYRSCTKSLCNNGTGKEPILNGFGNDIGPSGIIYAPGLGRNGGNMQLCSSVVLFILFVSIFIQLKID